MSSSSECDDIVAVPVVNACKFCTSSLTVPMRLRIERESLLAPALQSRLMHLHCERHRGSCSCRKRLLQEKHPITIRSHGSHLAVHWDRNFCVPPSETNGKIRENVLLVPTVIVGAAVLLLMPLLETRPRLAPRVRC